MDRAAAHVAWLDTQADLRDTAPSTTIVPRREVEHAINLLEQLAGSSLLASVQLRPGPVIGEGGMGVVREAEQVALGRTVAIKTLKQDKRTPEAAQGLLREAWVTGSLEHPNVVPVHHLGLDDDGMPALVLKRIEGVEWSKLIRNADEVKRRYGATDLLAWNLSILMQVLNAIRFAHSRGILHRDLKPQNVMIGDFGEVYLLDWGIAVSLRDDGSGRLPLAADATSIAGTPCYMAPEMLEREDDVVLSERTDVYLAGAVLYEIVTGHPPHEGKTALEVLTKVMASRPQVPDTVPAELAAICMKAMAPDPADRHASADEVRLALQAYLEHRGSDLLVARARARLDELFAVLASSPEDRARHREDVYRLFGACRFGFHEALAAWPGNSEARSALRRATIAVAEYELATGYAQAAVTLLGELDEPPALLEQARRAAESQADRKVQLEKLDHLHDLQVGRRQRGKLATTIGSVFSVAPVTVALAGIEVTYRDLLLWSTLFAVVTCVWFYVARRALNTTLVNRRLIGVFLFMFAAQFALVEAAYTMNISVPHTLTLWLFLYMVCASLAAINIDIALVPMAIGYAAAFAVAAHRTDLVLYMLSLGNLGFTLNAAYSWRLPHR